MLKTSPLLAGVLGNILEWLNFTLFVYFAPLLVTLFFPGNGHFTTAVISFSIIASDFLVRPLGGFFIGRLSDLHGRKKALIFTIGLVSITTLAIAILPTYSTIGIAAPIALVILRLIQSFGASGEINSAATFLVEHASQNRRGLTGSLVVMGCFVGGMLGSVIDNGAVKLLSAQEFADFGWRLVFIFAALLGTIGLIIRFKTSETPKFKNQILIIKHPIKTAFRHYWEFIMLAILLTSVVAASEYFFIGYFTALPTAKVGMPFDTAQSINLAIMVFFILSLLFYGYLSDKIGRRKVFLMGVIGFILVAYPAINLLARQDWQDTLTGAILFSIVLAPIAALIPTILAELFPTAIRNSASAIAYNLSLAIFSGTAPLISTAVVKESRDVLETAWFLIICAILSFVAALFMPEKYKEKLN